jgi:hypothetical protein
MERAVDVDAPSLAGLAAGRQDRGQGGLRLVLRHAECDRLRAEHDRLQRDHHQRRQRRLRPHLGARRSAARRPAARRPVSRPRGRHPLRCADRQFVRRRHADRQSRDGGESEPRASARPALARRRPARADPQHGDRSGVHRLLRRPSERQHPSGLSARVVLERQQRPRYDAAELPQCERAEPLQHRQLCAAAGDQPGVVRADGEQRLLHRHDRAAAPAAARPVSAGDRCEQRSNLCGPAARRHQSAQRGGELLAAVCRWIQRQRRLHRQPDQESGNRS